MSTASGPNMPPPIPSRRSFLREAGKWLGLPIVGYTVGSFVEGCQKTPEYLRWARDETYELIGGERTKKENGSAPDTNGEKEPEKGKGAVDPTKLDRLDDLSGVRWHEEDKKVVTFRPLPAEQAWVIIHSEAPNGAIVTGERYEHSKDLQDVSIYIVNQKDNTPRTFSVKLTPTSAPPRTPQ